MVADKHGLVRADVKNELLGPFSLAKVNVEVESRHRSHGCRVYTPTCLAGLFHGTKLSVQSLE